MQLATAEEEGRFCGKSRSALARAGRETAGMLSMYMRAAQALSMTDSLQAAAHHAPRPLHLRVRGIKQENYRIVLPLVRVHKRSFIPR